METMQAIAARKSTRSFQPDQIPESALDAVLNAGCAAPVGMAAYETLHLTVVQDKTLIQKISNLASGGKSDIFYGAPTVIIISSKAPPVPGLNYSNAGCIAENMLLAATDFGIANIYIFGTIRAFYALPMLLDDLEIPRGYQPVASVALGYPQEPDAAPKDREKTFTINRK